MTIEPSHITREDRKPAGHEIARDYGQLDLLELVRLIVKSANHQALKELHSRRRVFRLQDGRSLLLAEYLSLLKLREQNQGRNNARSISLSERAYDLTLDKFMNLPIRADQQGSDCRHYFGAFLKKVDNSLQQTPTTSRLEKEARSGAMLKNLVAKHFGYSIKEAVREADTFWSRYQWRVDGRSLILWMPSVMSGAERREWLEENIPTPFLYQPDGRDLIQEYIHKNLVREYFIPLDALEKNEEKSKDEFHFPTSENWGISLAKIVAREKAQNIDKQRRVIRSLGPEILAEMVRQIFLDIDAEEYEQKCIADQFGLSPASLSRFAGGGWHQKQCAENQAPDLWRNTAQVILQIPVFREVAEEKGMLERIEKIRGDDHE